MLPVDIEDVKKAVARVLMSSDFFRKLDAVYAEKAERYGDTLEVKYPTTVFESQRWQVDQPFPYGELNGGISRNLAGNQGGARHLMHEIQIYWHERCDSEEETDVRVTRLLRATRDYFDEFQYLEGLDAPPVGMNDDVFSPFVPANVFEGRPFLKSGLLVIYVESYGSPDPQQRW